MTDAITLDLSASHCLMKRDVLISLYVPLSRLTPFQPAFCSTLSLPPAASFNLRSSSPVPHFSSLKTNFAIVPEGAMGM